MGIALEIIASLVIAILFSIVLAYGIWRKPKLLGIVWFFLVIFLSIWVFAVWIPPIGPILMGGPWLSYFLVGLIVALLLIVFYPKLESATGADKDSIEQQDLDGRRLAISNFTWLLLLVLLTMIVFGYINRIQWLAH